MCLLYTEDVLNLTIIHLHHGVIGSASKYAPSKDCLYPYPYPPVTRNFSKYMFLTIFVRNNNGILGLATRMFFFEISSYNK